MPGKIQRDVIALLVREAIENYAQHSDDAVLASDYRAILDALCSTKRWPPRSLRRGVQPLLKGLSGRKGRQ